MGTVVSSNQITKPDSQMCTRFWTFLFICLHIVGFAQGQSLIQADTAHPAGRHVHSTPRGTTYLQRAYDDKILVYGYNALLNGRPSIIEYILFDGAGKHVPSFSPAYMLSKGNSPILHKAPGKFILYTPNINSATSTRRRVLLERIDTLGQPDATSFQVWGTTPNTGFSREDYTRVIIQQDGRMLIASNQDSVNGYYSPFLARIHPDGRVDTSFRSRFAGLRPNTLPISARISRLCQFANGNLALSFEGEYSYSSIRYEGHPLVPPGGYNSFPIMFLRADGSMVGFLHDSAYSLRLAYGESLGNHLYYTGYDYRDRTAILRRCKTNGAVDTSFGSIRILNTSGAYLQICGFLPDSSFIIRSDSGRGDGFQLQYSGRYGYAHILHDGSIDRSFTLPDYIGSLVQLFQTGPDRLFVGGMTAPSREGLAPNSILVLDSRLRLHSQRASTFSMPASCTQLVPTENGKYYAVGGFGVNDRNYPLIQRYNADGSLDTSFQLHANVRFSSVPNYGGMGEANCVLIRRDGRLIVGGSFAYTYRGRDVFGHIGLLPDGTLDTSYHPATLQFLQSSFSQGKVSNIAEDSLGNIYLSGYFNRANGLVRRGFVRLVPDGNVDTSFIGPDSLTLYPNTFSPMHILPEGGFVSSASFSRQGRFYSGLCRFSQDGRLDSTYLGISVFANSYFSASKFIPASDGSVFVLGTGYLHGENGHLLPAVRLLPGTRGIDTVWTRRLWLSSKEHVGVEPNGYYIYGGTRLPDGSLIATGELTYLGQSSYPKRTYPWIKILPNGTIDTTVNADSSIVHRARAKDALLLADGNLLVAGEFFFNWAPGVYPAANRTLMVYRMGFTSTDTPLAAFRQSLRVSPNPAHTTLTVQGPSGTFTTTLQDLTGHTVRIGNSPTLNLQGLAPGLYVLKVDGYAPSRVVIE